MHNSQVVLCVLSLKSNILAELSLKTVKFKQNKVTFKVQVLYFAQKKEAEAMFLLQKKFFVNFDKKDSTNNVENMNKNVFSWWKSLKAKIKKSFRRKEKRAVEKMGRRLKHG